eukprot:m.476601 g.476601  ORF g.476601 m.476601 type:complete len:356 (-) comp20584_c0_seq1:71-1138(-)
MALPSEYKAVGLAAYGGEEVLEERTLPLAAPTGRNLVVKVNAVSINPVDWKVRTGGMGTDLPESGFRVLGYDASGVVAAAGPEASLFKVGDEVFYAGTLMLDGTNGQYHTVDERIVGRKPSTLSHTDAAALPLVSLTAFELLYEGMALPLKGETPADSLTAEKTNPVVLILAGAGGVGSVAIQLVRALTPEATVIATASRPETVEFATKLGAHHVINHHKEMRPQIEALGFQGVDYALAPVDLDKVYDTLADLLLPLGVIGGITVADASKIDVSKLFMKRGRLVWEVMFTRSIFGARPERQNAALNRIADLVDSGAVKTTCTSTDQFSVEALKAAHGTSEAGKSIGKAVLNLEGY